MVEDVSKFEESFIKSYSEEINKGYFFEVDVQYPENLHNFHNDLPFLRERKKIEKVEKFITNLHDKTEYAIYIGNSKQALKHGLVLKESA